MPSPFDSHPLLATVSRRNLLKGSAAGLVALGGSGLVAACSSSKSSSTPAGSGGSTGAGSGGSAPAGSSGPASTAAAGGSITFGSNYSDPAVKTAFATLTAAATAATKVQIKINTVDHNTFQNNITSYLQGTPDDLATWFAGYRLQYFAAQGLLTPLDDVWNTIGSNFPDAAKALSKGLDGHYYLVPLYNYPWVIHYNKSTFAAKGYTIPTTWDQLLALAKKMKSDGLIPFAFADKDLWPALGTFDILDLRVNGFDYHMKLMRGQASYTDPQVTDVFTHWAQLLPYCQSGANGRIWEDAAKTLENKQAGMLFQGTDQVAANYAKAHLADLDFFPYPEINPTYAQDYMDAPADGFMLPKKGKNAAAAKHVLEYIGTGAAEAAYLKTDAWDVGLATDINQGAYDAIQKKSAKAIAACKNVSQFGDRDTDPAMAAALESLIQKFIQDPSTSTISSIQKSAAAQAKTIFG